MSELAQFHDRAAMERASERFVAAMQSRAALMRCGHRIEPENVKINSQGCRVCRVCERVSKRRYNARNKVERSERERLPRLLKMIESTREKLARLEREARERGQIV